MIVTWVTLEHANKPMVFYGKHTQTRDMKSSAHNTKFVEGSTIFHVNRAIITHLEPDTVYGK